MAVAAAVHRHQARTAPRRTHELLTLHEAMVKAGGNTAGALPEVDRKNGRPELTRLIADVCVKGLRPAV